MAYQVNQITGSGEWENNVAFCALVERNYEALDVLAEALFGEEVPLQNVQVHKADYNSHLVMFDHNNVGYVVKIREVQQ